MDTDRLRKLIFVTVILAPVACIGLGLLGGWATGEATGSSALLAFAILLSAWLFCVWLLVRGKGPLEKWWQLRLRNVLLSMALFGAGLALVRIEPTQPWSVIGALIARCGLFAAAIGMLVGRPVAGALIGTVAASAVLLYAWAVVS